jgi:cellulose synthase/poly-beta-1,6-N-acetylglucosamine synthase-like glycosyltransferase/exo-beta-1,3-glucanase (GH17 family)
MLVAAVTAGLLHAAAWFSSTESVSPADVRGDIDYVSYNPYVEGTDPRDGVDVSREQVTRELTAITEIARGVRTYSVDNGIDQVPAVAGKLGLNVSIGAWVGASAERDKAELDTVVQLAKQNRNVKSILVGNEVLLRKERTADELISMIRDVKRQVRLPVSTGEIWYLWLENPKLANAVDYLAVHILPYWEGVAAEDAVAYTIAKVDLLKKTYPGKRIVVAEFGWPSQGYNNLDAEPGALSQAEIIRDFVVEAKRRGIEYNIVEAIDQTWKTNEGSVGAYWGLFDADRNLKFPLTGLVEEQGTTWQAVLALSLGLVLTVIGLWSRRPTFAHGVAYGVAANAMSAGIVAAFAYPFENYMSFGIWTMWGLGFALVLLLTVLTLTKVHEIVEVILGRGPKRLIDGRSVSPAAGYAPKVSIHIPAYREPADMVIETLNSMAALDYPNFEVLVVVNNTPEARYSAPVAARCRELGERFKFLDITCKGFKAGALNIALDEHTAADAEIIAVVDADYVVEPGWLKDLVPAFADPSVALVQAPQDHRDGARSPLKTMMDTEYAGFFDIGMVQRNEDNAIIAHGTMLLVRRSALAQVGGWGTDTICEDTELGLRLFEAGYQAHYTRTRYGRGLLPDTFQAFKTQRFRWAYGAMQIIRKHWRHMLPASRTLVPAQKFHFVTGWSLWLADTLGACASVFNLLWVPVILLVGVLIPTTPFTLPVLVAFAVNVIHCVLLYGKRVNIPLDRVPGAAVAAMSLQLTVTRAVLKGLVGDSLPFMRTDKGGNAKRGSDNPAFWETVIGVLLVCAAATLVLVNEERITELTLFAATLAVQSLPFLAATFMVMIERYQDARVKLDVKAATMPALALEASPEIR